MSGAGGHADGGTGEPGSPCIQLCRIDEASGYCLGCRRSLQEIAGWGRMSPAEKRRVLAALAERAVPGDP